MIGYTRIDSRIAVPTCVSWIHWHTSKRDMDWNRGFRTWLVVCGLSTPVHVRPSAVYTCTGRCKHGSGRGLSELDRRRFRARMTAFQGSAARGEDKGSP